MMIQKLRLCLAYIEAFVGLWGQSLVGDFENGGQSDDDRVGELF